jgi:hypothetical protein
VEATASDLDQDLYLTNEVFLYRVTGPLEDEDDRLVDVEECYSLDVVRVPVREILKRGLRVVTPAATRLP